MSNIIHEANNLLEFNEANYKNIIASRISDEAKQAILDFISRNNSDEYDWTQLFVNVSEYNFEDGYKYLKTYLWADDYRILAEFASKYIFSPEQVRPHKYNYIINTEDSRIKVDPRGLIDYFEEELLQNHQFYLELTDAIKKEAAMNNFVVLTLENKNFVVINGRGWM